MKSENIETLKSVLVAIQNETQVIDSHPDPGALQDCWAEVWERIEAIEKDSPITDEFGNKWCNCDDPKLVPNRIAGEKGQAYCIQCHNNWYH